MQLPNAHHPLRSMTWHLHKAGYWRIPRDLKSLKFDDQGSVRPLSPLSTPHVHDDFL